MLLVPAPRYRLKLLYLSYIIPPVTRIFTRYHAASLCIIVARNLNPDTPPLSYIAPYTYTLYSATL